MAHQQTTNDIELKDLTRSLRKGSQSVSVFIFRIFRFFVRNSIILLALVIAGIIAGYFWQKNTGPLKKVELLVSLNAGSTAYVYNEIETFKKEQKGTEKAKNNTVLPSIVDVEIEPVVDLTEILDKFKTLDDEQIMMFMENVKDDHPLLQSAALRTNYSLHQISVYLDEQATPASVDSLLHKLENNSYYQSVLKEMREEDRAELRSNKFAIAQIDSLLRNVNRSLAKPNVSTAMIASEGLDLAGILRVREDIFLTNRKLMNEILLQEHLVYVVNNPLPKAYKPVSYYKVFWLPLLLIFVFVIGVACFKFYQKHASRLEE